MNLKDCIDKIISENKETKAFIEATNKKSADNALLDYVEYLNQSHYNSGLSLSFAYLLQFSNDPTLYEQFELKDIELLYDSFLELSDHLMDIYIDAASFADAIVENKNKAKQIVEKGMNKLKVQLAELQELANDLNS